MTSNLIRKSSNVDLYRQIHNSKEDYGAGSRHFEYVESILVCMRYSEVLDYGCGKGVLADQLTGKGVAKCSKYDPAIRGIDEVPDRTFNAIINTDVLEHIPEDELDSTLERFTALSQNAIIIPHLGKAREILPNGENAHCTIKTPDEWSSVFSRHYQHVVQLPHDSKWHALFLCMQEIQRTECVALTLEHLVRSRTGPDEVRVSLGAPFILRLKLATKVLFGQRVVNLIRRISGLFRRRKQAD